MSEGSAQGGEEMKKIGEYTARGQLTENESEASDGVRITLFDGRFDTAYRVTSFRIWGSDWSGSTTPDVIGKLATVRGLSDAAADFMNAGDQREIAWAGGNGASDLLIVGDSIIDPDNMVVEDLFIYARGATDTADVNYLITMDKYDITDWQGALAMVRNRAQG